MITNQAFCFVYCVRENLERFTFEYQKVIGFALLRYIIGLKKKTRANFSSNQK